MERTPLLKTFVLILVILDSKSIPSFSCPLHQKLALLHFKATLSTIMNSYSSSNLDSWNTTSDCCSWERVNCSKTGTVTELHLYQLVPPPDDKPTLVYSDILNPLFQIQSLEVLDISYNSLAGEIPGVGFGNLTELVHLNMFDNRFNGSIPSQIFELKYLKKLVLSQNILNGVLSPEVCKLQNLEYLSLKANYLYGTIPKEIGNLTKLQTFYLQNNGFFGEVLSSIINSKNLQYLDLSENSFTGNIPNSIGILSNIIALDLSHNKFTGPIPASMQNLSRLDIIRLNKNMFNGGFPTWLFEITTLNDISICGEGNNLIWNYTAKIVSRCNPHFIAMRSCGISGQIPEWVSAHKNLIFLDLSLNKLEGRFPGWLAKMNTQILDLSGNNLTGSIPSRIFESVDLLVLQLSRNKFSGELPYNIGNAKSLGVLLLSENNLSGELPVSIQRLNNLLQMDLSNNRFFGDTSVFRDNAQLTALDLSYNNFSGKIPTNLPEGIRSLNLGHNKFSGNLPWNLSKLAQLRDLVIHDNNITGNLQDILPQIPTLVEILILRNNSLKGYIPNKISNLTSLRILDLSQNNIHGSMPRELANLPVLIKTLDIPPPQPSSHPIQAFGGDNFNSPLIVNWKRTFQGLHKRNVDTYCMLDLSRNEISGEIHASLGNLKALKLLNISHNMISGHIPISFGDLENIESLDLSHNEISGSIPQSLVKLHQLTVLNVSNNRLKGKIPVGGQMDTMNGFENNTGLCGMQINVTCPEDNIPPSQGMKDEDEDEDEKESWFMWEGTWVGFPVGFFTSILIMGYFLGFLRLFKIW